ncbi:hypothetical protein [Flavobacterium ardleyense]|uniref:hypothetical protein n=1 Tax=Flavobacterium ardleyense TaxID=2038737 RepID=UPI00298CE489|nr:hypothetical protein [Flavobacterium ardleyense]
MKTTKFQLAIVSVFLWIGFVCAISFMEAWLKFRAPGVTLPIGLGIGRMVFAALNMMEWLFAILIAANLVMSKNKITSFSNLAYFIPLLMLLLQTFWLLPSLDSRAEIYIQGQVPPASTLHYYYVGVEIIKVVCLSIFGIKLFTKS